MAASSNQGNRRNSYKDLLDQYDALTRHVKQGLQAQVGNKGAEPQLSAAPAPPAMRQRASSVSSAFAQVMKGNDVCRVDGGTSPDSTKLRKHVRSASASSTEWLSFNAVSLQNRHSMRSSKSEENLVVALEKSHVDETLPSAEGRKRGLRRRMKDHTRDWLGRKSRKSEQPVPVDADPIGLPGERAASLLKMLAPEDARPLRLKLTGLRNELEAGRASDKRKNHRLRDFLAGELKALDDDKISAAINQIPIGEALNMELDILRSELEKRDRFSRIDKRIDTADPLISSEIDRLYTHHFFTRAPDIPGLPSSLQGLAELLPPLFLARMGETILTLCMTPARDEVLVMPKEHSGNPVMQSQWKRSAANSLAKFVGPSADGLLLWTVGEHLGPAFHHFMMDLLFNREGSDGKPESELHRYDGKPIRPLGKASVCHRLQRRGDGSIVIEYIAQISPTNHSGVLVQATLLEDSTQHWEVDPGAHLHVSAQVTVHGSRDVEISDIRVRASGWNGG